MAASNWLSNIQQWVESAFHINDAQSAPIIITLTVFITGGLVKYVSGQIKRIGTRKATRRQFRILIEHLAVGTAKQAQEIAASAQTYNMENAQAFHIGIVDFYQHTIVKAIGYEKVCDAFFLGFENRWLFRMRQRPDRLQAYHECWRALEAIPKWQEKVISDAKFVLDYYNQQNAKRNEQLIELEKATYEQFERLIGVGPANVSYQYLNEIMALKARLNQTQNPTSPINVQNIYVKPGLELSESKPLPAAQELRFVFSAAFLTYENMDRMLIVYKEQFVKHKQHLEKYSADLMRVIEVMKPFGAKKRRKSS
jgi:hypothetical protein